MRLLSTSPDEFGVFSLGQFAFGIIALGQVAVGVVAVGQVSFSIVGVGQVGGGIAWFAGMLGIGGRGFCLRLIPGLDVARQKPAEVSLDAAMRGSQSGFVRLGVAPVQGGAVLVANGQVLAVKLKPDVAWALSLAVSQFSIREVYAFLRREGDVLVCNRLMEIPGQRKRTMPLWLDILRVVGLVVLATAWCYVFSELGPQR